MQQPFFACDYSLEVGETQYATAPHTETWLLLEYPRPFGAQAYAESSLPDAVKAHIDAEMSLMPNPRLQLIRHDLREALTEITLYVIRADWRTQTIRRFVLPDYEALSGLPLAQIAAGEVDAGKPIEEPVFIVCSNGKRDSCCAKHGAPLYNAMRSAAGEHVWQSDHIGGHRFAGTLVAFPHGMYYGRLHPDHVPVLVEKVRRGEVLLEHSRGRAGVDAPIQAAEHFLRQATGILALDAFDAPSVEMFDQGWAFTFTEIATGMSHQVTISSEPTPFVVISNSSDAGGKPGQQYRLAGIRSSPHG